VPSGQRRYVLGASAQNANARCVASIICKAPLPCYCIHVVPNTVSMRFRGGIVRTHRRRVGICRRGRGRDVSRQSARHTRCRSRPRGLGPHLRAAHGLAVEARGTTAVRWREGKVVEWLFGFESKEAALQALGLRKYAMPRTKRRGCGRPDSPVGSRRCQRVATSLAIPEPFNCDSLRRRGSRTERSARGVLRNGV
jgi:hypothetical protein